MIAKTPSVDGSNPLLLPDRDEPYRLHEVLEKTTYGCRDEIILDFGDCFLRFGVDADYDTITAQFQGRAFGPKRGYRRIGSVAPWNRHLNENCGWTWLAINQQGYWDSVLISFEAVVPNVLLNVMASSLYVFAISPMETIASREATKLKNKKAHSESDRSISKLDRELSKKGARQ